MAHGTAREARFVCLPSLFTAKPRDAFRHLASWDRFCFPARLENTSFLLALAPIEADALIGKMSGRTITTPAFDVWYGAGSNEEKLKATLKAGLLFEGRPKNGSHR